MRLCLPLANFNSLGQGARRAFTLVELLVVIAIIGVLVALLLPAVQAARESARRIQCVNQIKQLALASLNYESANKRLPNSGLVNSSLLSYLRQYPAYDQRSGRMLSWVVLLLPYIEQQPLFDRFDMTRRVTDQSTNPQAETIESLLCPSDDARGKFYSDPEATRGKRMAKGNYAAFCSTMHTDLQESYPGAFISSGLPLRQVTDGTNATIALSEVRTLDFTTDERGAWALPWNASTLLAFDMHHNTRGRTLGWFEDFAPLAATAYQTQTPNHQGPNVDVLVNCPPAHLAAAQVAGMPCDSWIGILGFFGYSSAAPRSLHPGGVNAAYLDGHVEFLLDDVNPFIMAVLIGIKDGTVPQEGEVIRPQ